MNIPDVLPLLKEYKNIEGNGAGGSLHRVFEGNVCDDDVKYCINYAIESKDTLGQELAEILLSMSKTQRNKLGAIFYNLEILC